MSNQTSKKVLSLNQTEFISRISHELKNPLTYIFSILQFLDKQHPDLNEDILWLQLKEEVKDLDHILNMLLSPSKEIAANPQPMDLHELLIGLELAWKPAAEHDQKQLIFDIEPLPEFTGDAVQLKLALTNLIRNSLEATSPQDTIRLHAQATKDHILLTLTDTGIGIHEDQLAHIFEPFVTYKPSGTGIGLPQTKQYIENHGGTISVDSIYHKGTTFRIQLPINCLS